MNTDDLRTVLAERAETVDASRPGRLAEVHRRIEAASSRRLRAGIGAAARAPFHATGLAPGDAPDRRLPVMNTTLRIAVAAAVVIAASLVGVSYITGRDDAAPTTGQGPASTPSPTATFPLSGELDPGRYSVPILGTSEIRADVTVEGEEWTYAGPDSSGVAVLARPEESVAGNVWLGLWTVGPVYADPCTPGAGASTLPADHSTADLVAALDAQVGSELSAPTDVVVDGYPGVRANLTVTCDQGDLWTTPSGLHRYSGAGSSELWIVDVDGTTVVIDAQTAQVDAEIEAMVDSMTFTTP